MGHENPQENDRRKAQKLREQGYEDGRLGRRRRWPTEPIYCRHYIHGQRSAARQKDDG